MKQPYHDIKAEFFKTLAHPLRLAILDQLRDGEKNVSDLQELLNVEQAAVSQQLARLRRGNMVFARKQGTTVFYSVPDPTLYDILDMVQTVFHNQVEGTQAILEQHSH